MERVINPPMVRLHMKIIIINWIFNFQKLMMAYLFFVIKFLTHSHGHGNQSQSQKGSSLERLLKCVKSLWINTYKGLHEDFNLRTHRSWSFKKILRMIWCGMESKKTSAASFHRCSSFFFNLKLGHIYVSNTRG